ncbi:hypothetical protein FKM82_002223 [Ascaphus truei]
MRKLVSIVLTAACCSIAAAWKKLNVPSRYTIIKRVNEVKLMEKLSAIVGHPLRLEEGKFQQQQRKGFFTVRAVKMWNSLPIETVMADTIDLFKKRLDIFLDGKGIQGYIK